MLSVLYHNKKLEKKYTGEKQNQVVNWKGGKYYF